MCPTTCAASRRQLFAVAETLPCPGCVEYGPPVEVIVVFVRAPGKVGQAVAGDQQPGGIGAGLSPTHRQAVLAARKIHIT